MIWKFDKVPQDVHVGSELAARVFQPQLAAEADKATSSIRKVEATVKAVAATAKPSATPAASTTAKKPEPAAGDSAGEGMEAWNVIHVLAVIEGAM